MNCYINDVIKIMKKIIWDAERCLSQFLIDEIDVLRVGLVTYRDHEDEGISYLTNIDIDLTTNIKEVVKLINLLNCWGGKDELRLCSMD